MSAAASWHPARGGAAELILPNGTIIGSVSRSGSLWAWWSLSESGHAPTRVGAMRAARLAWARCEAAA